VRKILAAPVFFQAIELKMKVCTKPDLLKPFSSKSSKLSAYSRKDFLSPLRNWFETLEIRDPKIAHWICAFIPAQCPFERDVQLLGRTLLHIPPLCKLNPFYDQFVMLRFRALSFLVDQCGEDVTRYCR
jgi:Mo-dependent nitrogenase C-terminus